MTEQRPLPDEGEVQATVELLAAVAHPARLTVLLALSRRGPLSAGDLQHLAGLEQSAMSHQLRVLRKARLIRAERQGRQMIYALDDHHVAHIIEDALTHTRE